ncbi:hypothetical protein [Zhongshania sp.]|uniref:hypothetical protein n=1 Tax=Zhongshania sp. TaxID=1971902 RepID=UPI0039E49736
MLAQYCTGGPPHRFKTIVGNWRGQKTVALIPEGEPGAGGSYVMSQQWVHNLRSFSALNQSEQEAVIGFVPSPTVLNWTTRQCRTIPMLAAVM